ncbi:hypothetical protein P154DRAFT_554760 [Amniculicola lignicola CBS 123094]|uniref:Uncharacterized protein n=1 Tax=Amniculicola lignicola CBS 123094 TaxID=1392246 RepID=A0A6A5WFE3_9PLEO|nr:hypothetical protein P154DRAFT_554760 [Amniculicola lignicola CBS 123094]
MHTMGSLCLRFLLPSIQGYKNKIISHEAKFDSFMSWANPPRGMNFGPLESKRYFAKNDGATGEPAFVEVSEKWLVVANFQKLNAFKNYKCGAHNKFFEINVYEKDPVSLRYWRADVARPATDVDL